MHPLFQVSDHGLTRSAQRASILNLIGGAVDLFFQLLSLTVLARILTPADFGLFAMITPFVWFITNFGDLGLGSAVLQQRHLTEGQAAAVFRVNLLAGLAFAGLFVAASPLLALFYHDDRVMPVAAALSLVFVISGFSAVQRALLRRALVFGALLRAQIAASIISCLAAIIVALMGGQYWALVARAITEPLVYTVVVWFSTKWLPRQPEWDTVTSSLLRFGRYYIGYSVLNAATRQGDNILIGWRFGSAELGPYALAYRLFLIPIQQVTWPIANVMIPAFSRLRADPDRLRRWYSGLLRALALVAFPPLFSLTVCADDLIYILAGPQWNDAANVLRVLAPASALQMAYATADWLMQAHGKADRAFRWALINAGTYLTCFVVGLSWGALGVAIGVAAANVLLFVPGVIYATKDTPIGLADVLKAMLPACGLTLISVAATYELRILLVDWHPFARLLVTGLVLALGILLGGSLLYRRYWPEYAVNLPRWIYRAASPVHEWRRWRVYRRRNQQLEHRIALLRQWKAQHASAKVKSCTTLAELCPELDRICRPLRHSNREIPLADIDQDGFLSPRFGVLWPAPVADRGSFRPRIRFDLTVVDVDGFVGVCKSFRGDKAAFVNELEAALDLTAAGCNVPAVLKVDFEQTSITFAYINGMVVREGLAQAGAQILRDRSMPSTCSRFRGYRLEKERLSAAMSVLHKVLDRETITRAGEALLAIHRAGYTLEDVKYGNVIIEATTGKPYFIDCERALLLREFPRATADYLRAGDAHKFDQHFGTTLLSTISSANR
jgi:PST family polysaccharide transporter